jgi:hypothetical protein
MSQENVEIARRSFEAFNRTFNEGTPDLYELLDADASGSPCRRSWKETPITATTGCADISRT